MGQKENYKVSKFKVGGSIYRKSIFQVASGENEDERVELGIKMAESEASTDRSEQVKYCIHKHSDPSTFST